MIYAGIYPVDNEDLEKLNEALQKLTLNDSSVTAEKETSDALGSGFRCGFLGLLHMDVFVQRLEEEYNVSVIATSPTVPYKVIRKRTGSDEDKEELIVTNPSQFPEHSMHCFGMLLIVSLEYFVEFFLLLLSTDFPCCPRTYRERHSSLPEFLSWANYGAVSGSSRKAN